MTDKPRHLWVNGVVAQRDRQPYIQLSNENQMIAQLDLASARQFADDIVEMCARTEVDAMIYNFFAKQGFGEDAAGFMVQGFRDFRAEQDKPRGRPAGEVDGKEPDASS